ncbi:hypothetical protein H0H92_013029 [Tricholoma furcatifolium]|nr:hypothetical protein H0H92_013029 [Tricholoma furcatifolium]
MVTQMTRDGWTSPAQFEFLESRIASYLDAQKNCNYVLFWANLFEAWEAEFSTRTSLYGDKPLEEFSGVETAALSTALSQKRAQLQTWFRWHASSKSRTASKQSSKLDEVLDAAVRSRLPHRSQIYAKLYWDSVLKDKVLPALTVPGKSWARGEKMATRNKLVRDLWDQETDLTVKAAVEEHLSKLMAERQKDVKVDQTRTPEEYAEGLKELPTFLGNVLHGLRQRTGWSFSVLMGGPDPSIRGEINVASFHVGENGAGLEFGKAVANFDRDFMEPYTEFLVGVYPPEVRRARALGAGRDELKAEASRKGDGHLGEEGNMVETDVPTHPSPILATVLDSVGAKLPIVSATPRVPESSSPVPLASPSPPALLGSPSTIPLVSPVALPSASPPAPVGSPSTIPPATPVALPPASPPAPLASPSTIVPVTPVAVPSVPNASVVADPFGVDFQEFLASLNDPAMAGGNGPDDFSLLQPRLDEYEWPHDFFTQLNQISMPPAAMPSSVSNVPAIPSLDVPPAAIVSLENAPALPSADTPPNPSDPIFLPQPTSPAESSTPAVEAPRSVRNRIASKRHEEMNNIGTNAPLRKGKENVPPVTVPERATWRYPAEAYLLLSDLGPDWIKCVNAWIAVEDTLPSASRAGLAVKSRPDEWQKWASKSINGSRVYTMTPAISDALEFGYAVMNWWKSLQPEFRSTSDVLPAPGYDPPAAGDGASDPWALLRKGGPNGLVAVLMLLNWWGLALGIDTHADARSFWERTVGDVTMCLEKIASTPAAGKRKRGSAASHPSKRIKK